MRLRMGRRGLSALVAVAATTAVGGAVLTGGSARADTKGPIDFEGYSVGSLYGQQGWSGALGGCGKIYDTGVVANTAGAPAAFGTKSLRMSNAVTTGCFGDQLFSPKLVDEAGETRARATSTGGVRQAQFTAQWTVASATGGVQPGLFTSISPDNGEGARMSYVSQYYGTDNLLHFNFVDVRGLDPSVPATDPSYPSTNFVDHDLGGYDPGVPHTVRLVVRFVDGQHNDVVLAYVDGALKATGTSWEDYYDLDKEAQGAGPSAVNSLIFRESGTAHPELAGKGFLFDGISTQSGPLTPYAATTVKALPVVISKNYGLTVLVGLRARLTTSAGAPIAGEPLVFTVGKAKACTAVTDANGYGNCAKLLSVLQLSSLSRPGYVATFPGDDTYLTSSDKGYYFH